MEKRVTINGKNDNSTNKKPRIKRVDLHKVSIKEVEANRSKAYSYLFQ